MERRKKKKKIGMLVAVEMDAVLRRYGTAKRVEKRHGFEMHLYDMGEYEVYVLRSGAGEIAAAAAAELLIDRYEVELIVNFGVVGGLTAEMAQTKTCVVEKVVHYDFDTTEYDHCLPGQYMGYEDAYLRPDPALIHKAVALFPQLKRVTCASGDKFVAGEAAKSALHERWGADICEMEAAKSALHERWGADICEMEAAAVVLTCDRAGIPCLLIKTVSDGLTQGGEDFGTALQHTSELCLEVADRIIREL